MSKIAIISTSTGSLDYIDQTFDDLYILRMQLLLKDETYDDYIGITAGEFYKRLTEDKSLVPSSSMPPIGMLLAQLEELEEKGYEDVIVITLSSGLSGTYNGCLLVKNQYQGKLKIHIVDSLNAAITEGYLSIMALDMIKEGKTATQIVKYLETIRIKRKQYFMVDNLRLFVANGRLTGAAGFIGSMFKIKPILQVNNEGKIVPFEKIRTQRRSLERMVEVLLKDLESVEDFVITYISSDNLKGIEYAKNRIREVYPNHKFIEAPITPVIGCHTGVGTVGLAFYDISKK